MFWRSFFLFFLFSPFALAVTPEEQNGCSDSPDRSSAEEVCSIYKKIEGYYGKYALTVPGEGSKDRIANEEPDLCRAYYLLYMRGRNILCAYRKEGAEFASKVLRAPLPPPGKLMTKDQVENFVSASVNYRAAKAMHKKYLDLITNNQKELQRWYSSF